jgi:hypothetical protein
MEYIHKRGFKIINNKLQNAYDIEVKRNNKGYNITGFNNDKIIKKSVRYVAKKNTKKRKTKKYKK